MKQIASAYGTGGERLDSHFIRLEAWANERVNCSGVCMKQLILAALGSCCNLLTSDAVAPAAPPEVRLDDGESQSVDSPDGKAEQWSVEQC